MTISATALTTGARAVTAAEAVGDIEVLIVSAPMNRNTDTADIVRTAPRDAAVIDTSNHYPRGTALWRIDEAQVKSH